MVLFGGFILGCALQLLGTIDVVLLGELQVLQELGVHSFHLDELLGRWLPGWVPVPLVGLVVIGVILRLGHREGGGLILICLE